MIGLNRTARFIFSNRVKPRIFLNYWVGFLIVFGLQACSPDKQQDKQPKQLATPIPISKLEIDLHLINQGESQARLDSLQFNFQLSHQSNAYTKLQNLSLKDKPYLLTFDDIPPGLGNLDFQVLQKRTNGQNSIILYTSQIENIQLLPNQTRRLPLEIEMPDIHNPEQFAPLKKRRFIEQVFIRDPYGAVLHNQMDLNAVQIVNPQPATVIISPHQLRVTPLDKQAYSLASAQQRIGLLFDTSGSMSFDALRGQSIAPFTEMLTAQGQIGLFKLVSEGNFGPSEYSSFLEILVDFTSDKNQLLNASGITSSGSSPVFEAIESLTEYMQNLFSLQQDQHIVVFTDGYISTYTFERILNLAKLNKIAIHSVLIDGSNNDLKTLSESTGGLYLQAASVDDLGPLLKHLSRAIARTAILDLEVNTDLPPGTHYTGEVRVERQDKRLFIPFDFKI